MKKLIIILLLLPALMHGQVRTAAANAMARIVDWGTAPAGPILLRGDTVVVNPIPLDDEGFVTNQLKQENILTGVYTAGQWPTVDDENNIVWRTGNASSTPQAFVSSGNQTYLQNLLRSILIDPATRSALGLTMDGYWRNVPYGLDDRSMRTMLKYGNKVLGESFPYFAVTAGSSVSDNSFKCADIDVKFDGIAKGIAYEQFAQGDYTADQTNALALYELDTATKVYTRLFQTANDGNQWKNTAGSFVSVDFTTTDTIYSNKIYVGCAIQNYSVQVTPMTIGHSASLNSGNAGVMTMRNPTNVKFAFQVTGQNSFPSTFNASSTTALTTFPYFQIYYQ